MKLPLVINGNPSVPTLDADDMKTVMVEKLTNVMDFCPEISIR